MLTPGTKLGPYEILAGLGAGGMGEVYRARDTRLGRDVALKILPEAFAADPERTARLEREAKVLASLNHPNIASIYGFEDSRATGVSGFALVMELVEGQTLANRIARGPIPADEALPISRQICEGLEYAHERAIVHRDLKPANIKITPEGAVKLLDFGLAKALAGEPATGDAATSPTISRLATQAGIILGTAAYMSPEQAKGKAVDSRADIWSFGCVLYEMLTGKAAFQGETVTDILAAVVRAEPDWSLLPAGTSPRIRNLLRSCFAKDPRQRLQAIGDGRIAIEEAVSGKPAEEALGLAAPPRPSRRELAAWALFSIAALAAIAAGAWAWLRPRARSATPPVLAYIPPPPGTSFRYFGFGAGPVVLSPDGQQLAFSATDQKGATQIWVRPLAGGLAAALAGTEDGSSPFWSADGRSLGFVADGKLKTVLVASDTVQVLADTNCALPGAWSTQGAIVFTPQCGGPLVSLPAIGGSARPLVRPADSFASLGAPAFLPGDHDFLYESHDKTYSQSIWMASLTTGKSRLVLENAGSPQFANGYLLFVRGGKLFAQPFDPPSGKLTGDLSFLALAHDFSASANGVIAFQGGTPTARLMWLDRSGNALGTIGEARSWTSPRISPDGKQVAAVDWGGPNGGTDSPNGGADLWAFPANGGVGTRLTFRQGVKAFAAWSPDGKYVAYACYPGGNPAICRRPADGSGAEQILRKLGSDIQAASVIDWSPDGRYLSYDLLSAKGRRWSSWVLPLPGDGQPFQPAPVNADQYDGNFSPDGRWFSYFSYETGRPEVFVVSFPAPGAKYEISQTGGWALRWGAGDKLFFLSMGNRMMEAGLVVSGKSLQVRSLDPLFSLSLPMANAPLFDVTPDGSRFIAAVAADPAAANFITVLLNWPALLNRR